MILRAALLLIVVLSPTSSFADVLSSSQIKQTVIGKRVFLATRYDVEFPLVYRANGTVKGDGTGTGLGRFFAPKETGKWSIQGKELCQEFPTWYDGKTQCFTLEKIGANKLKWKTRDGRSGTATIK